MPKTGPIIIVDDDIDDQELLRETFEELKVPNGLRFFNTSLEALNYLLTTIEKPFIIISDINLPAISGFDFLKKINDNHSLKTKCIPFIFLTTTSNSATIEQAYQLPAQGFFVKPLNGTQYKQTVNAIVEYWKAAGRPV
jgi:CheY-like chemotaxis protein